MAAKKRGGSSGKRVARRETSPERPRAKRTPPPPETEDKPVIQERIREKDAGFGVIKVAVGVIIALIIGATALSRLTGTEDAARGDKLPGEMCESTTECEKGNICLAYHGDQRRCWKLCRPDSPDCEPGYSCVSSAQRSGRKGVRVRSICVEDAKAR